MWSCRRILGGAAITVLVASGADSAQAARVTYGGFTAQNWPISIEVSSDRREVVRTGIGFDITCTSGSTRLDLDRYRNLVLHRNGRFSASYSNSRTDFPDGTYVVYGGSVAGRLNRARTSISGTATLHYTQHDASGAVVNSCDSGRVKYRAK